MRTVRIVLVSVLLTWVCTAQAQNAAFAGRRKRAANAFRDGVLLLHASSALDMTADGFRQDPYFYYFTGLENTVGALLAIDGRSGESWLFLPSNPPFMKRGLQPEAQPGAESEKRLAIEHVVDWTNLESFLAARGGSAAILYYADDRSEFDELPAILLSQKSPNARAWLQLILQKWPAFETKDASERIQSLMEVQSADELAALRKAAKATVSALIAGMRAIRS